MKGAGKDTAAGFLRDKAFRRIAFADELYRQVADTFGVTVEFLNNRDTKELPLQELALRNCRDTRFVGVCRTLDADISRDEFLFSPRSPRQVLQRWGTEYRRALDKDSYWLDIVRAEIDRSPGQNFVITDVRFPNEAKFVTQLEGYLFRIRRPLLEASAAADRETKGTAAHDSELALQYWPTNATFINDEGRPDRLETEVHAFVEGLTSVLA
ncbi:hypothetical protein F6X40_10490 [Paraburkholderia sp. UCT31]|uniref:hypothetical protein n=1 Tax=Paraburkholderia sp. UCT31 TaxID=2615209 RepID=UPI0016556FCC|nr:hypothetical protein [Paraburkholderia sp. UCT31]MBC8737235.1 hypothetical protein [Paraburkholderia sp. UCT31]